MLFVVFLVLLCCLDGTWLDVWLVFACGLFWMLVDFALFGFRVFLVWCSVCVDFGVCVWRLFRCYDCNLVLQFACNLLLFGTCNLQILVLCFVVFAFFAWVLAFGVLCSFGYLH